jgi:hypothetical protein
MAKITRIDASAGGVTDTFALQLGAAAPAPTPTTNLSSLNCEGRVSERLD